MQITVPEIKKPSNTTKDNIVKELREEVRLHMKKFTKFNMMILMIIINNPLKI